jgi:hypothetical protein
LQSFVHPALDVYAEYLQTASEPVRFAVARDVLERNGFKPSEEALVDQPPVRITVHFDRANQETFQLPDGA